MQRAREALVGIEREEMRLRARAEAAEMTSGQRADAEARKANLVTWLASSETKLASTRQAPSGAGQAACPGPGGYRSSIDGASGRESAATAARRALDGLRGEERALSGLKTEKPTGTARLLVDEIQVALQYRRAIVVALGAAAQYQIVDATDTAWFVQESGVQKAAEPVLVPRGRAIDAGVWTASEPRCPRHWAMQRSTSSPPTLRQERTPAGLRPVISARPLWCRLWRRHVRSPLA